MAGDSFRRQTQLAVDYAEKHGLELDETLTFRDLGVSAFRSKNARQGALRAFLDVVEDGAVEQGSYLLVESLDRISRDEILAAQGWFLQIVNAGVTLVTLADGRAYSKETINANPTDLILSLVVMMRARDESAMKAARLQASWSAKRAKAAEKPLTSVCPAWLELREGKFAVIEERAAVVRRIFDEAATGRGRHAIAEGLNRDGIPTFGHRGRRGAYWHRSYVTKILGSDTVIGTYTPHRMDHSGGKAKRVALAAVPNYYPAVVATETWDAVRSLAVTHQPLRGRHANAGIVRNVLGGLARCPACGGAMIRVHKGRAKVPEEATASAPWAYLVCAKAKAGAGCAYRSVRYADVERAILEGVDHIEYQCPTGVPEADRVLSEIAALDQQLELLKDDIARLLPNAARSPVIAQRVLELEREVDAAKAQQTTLGRGMDLDLPARLQGRLDAFRAACGELQAADGVDPEGALRAAVNASLRSLCGSVEVDYERGGLILDFLHGGAAALTYDWLFGRRERGDVFQAEPTPSR
jgi:DNA invertase Pin-like site-specific DNA recombinase